MNRQRHPETQKLLDRLSAELHDGTAPATRVYNALTLIARDSSESGLAFGSVREVRSYARSVLAAAGMRESSE